MDPTTQPTPEPRARQSDADLTARARIRAAAIARFATDGVTATSLRSIADDVGVSPPLIVHHFGSKEGLRAACDEHVAATIRARKHEAMTGGMDPLEAFRQSEQGPPLLRYLAQTLVDGSPHVSALIDEMLEDAVAYMAEGVEHGLLKPTDSPRSRAVVLLMWQLGALVLHDHVERLLSVDLTGDLEGALAWAVPAAEILANGVLEDAFYEQWRDSARELVADQD